MSRHKPSGAHRTWLRNDPAPWRWRRGAGRTRSYATRIVERNLFSSDCSDSACRTMLLPGTDDGGEDLAYLPDHRGDVADRRHRFAGRPLDIVDCAAISSVAFAACVARFYLTGHHGEALACFAGARLRWRRIARRALTIACPCRSNDARLDMVGAGTACLPLLRRPFRPRDAGGNGAGGAISEPCGMNSSIWGECE